MPLTQMVAYGMPDFHIDQPWNPVIMRNSDNDLTIITPPKTIDITYVGWLLSKISNLLSFS